MYNACFDFLLDLALSAALLSILFASMYVLRPSPAFIDVDVVVVLACEEKRVGKASFGPVTSTVKDILRKSVWANGGQEG